MKCECSPFSYVSKPQLIVSARRVVSVESSQNVRMLSARTMAISPSSRNTACCVCRTIAAMSDATKFSLLPRPRTTGLPLRATTMHPGCVRSMTAIPYVPSTTASALRTASGRSSVPAVATRWAITSESVSDANFAPCSSRRSRIDVAFSMIPLCTTAIRPEPSVCGWALTSLGSPCVAHRVWPMPVPRSAAGRSIARRVATLPLVLTIESPSWVSTAIPAES